MTCLSSFSKRPRSMYSQAESLGWMPSAMMRLNLDLAWGRMVEGEMRMVGEERMIVGEERMI
eukprot:3075830-Rhodomonas_salina.1